MGKRHHYALTALALVGLLAAAPGCKSKVVTNPETVAALVKEGRRPIPHTPKLKVETIKTVPPAGREEYRIAPGDVVRVTVVGHPELSAAARPDGSLIGLRVGTDGDIQLPSGPAKASGRTVSELRSAVVQAMEKYVKKPRVVVDILEYGSQKFFVLGQVQRPGVFAVDGNVTLLEGLAKAGGTNPNGDIEGAYVIRAGKLLPVSLGDMLLRGDTSRNVALRHRDLIFVPDKADWKVYVLGEVVRPGVVPMGDRGLNLADAVASVGGPDKLNADKNVIRIFRGSWQNPRAYTVSVEDLYRHGNVIALKPYDRIVVAPRGLANWSRAVTLLLPFLQTAVTAGTVAASR